MNMNNINLINIILCGGIGSRLWPLSSKNYPKQFLNFNDKFTLFQNTILRHNKIAKKTIIVSNAKYLPLIEIQTNEINKNIDKIILEPFGRNTAPAIALACLSLNDDDIVLITPSDHFIKKNKEYLNSVNRAKILANSGFIVTFGIKPAYPETQFGYIKSNGDNVISFHEKPNLKNAKKYYISNKYFWNSGIFIFKVKTYLDELKKYSNDIFVSSSKAFHKSKTINNKILLKKELMDKIPSNSIDYAVLEKSKIVKMISTDIVWSDLGSFDSLYFNSNKDKNGNFFKSKSITIYSNNNFIFTDKKLNVLIDVDDLIVIDSSDSLLICRRGSSHKIKQLPIIKI